MSTASPPTLQAIRAIGKQTAARAGDTNIELFFTANRHLIAAVLPRHMTHERMIRIALRCFRTEPKLLKCELSTFMGAVITCAQLGLEPNTPQGHIYIIPFENKRKRITEAQVVIGYKGLLVLSRRSGEIVSISSRAVYARDDLNIEYGCDERCVVKPFLDGDAGPIRGFLAVARLKDGGTQFEYMTARQVEEIRDASEGYKASVATGSLDKSPWTTSFVEMGRKTAIRRICKYLPMSVELANLLAREDAADRGVSQGLEDVIHLSPDDVLDLELEPEGDAAAAAAIDQPGEPKVAPKLEHEVAITIPSADILESGEPDPASLAEIREIHAPESIAPGRPASLRATRRDSAPMVDSDDDGFGCVE